MTVICYALSVGTAAGEVIGYELGPSDFLITSFISDFVERILS
jgi:hypothetical protein